jgi:hypothetical protein
MGTFERLVLRMADWNGTWWGLGWIRPAKYQRISPGRFTLLVFVLAAPGALAGLGLIFLALGKLDPGVAVIVIGGLVLLQACLNAPLVYFWNRRASAFCGPEPGKC